MINLFQARTGIYPTVPAAWPNRSIRRAIRFGRTLPQMWAGFFAIHPDYLKSIKTNRAMA